MKEIIKSIKNAKVEKDKKWLYTFAAYILQHQNDENFRSKLTNRINSTIRSHNKQYKKYISDTKLIEYRKKEREVYKTNEKQRQYQLEQQRKRRVIYKLYQDKKLSIESIDIIERELENER